MPSTEEAPGRDRLPTICLAVAGGATLFILSTVLAFPPSSLWPLALLAPAALGYVGLRGASRPGVTALIVFLAGVVLWLWMSRWMVQVTPVGLVLYALIMAIYPALFVWMIGRISRHAGLSRWPLTFVLPVIWVGIEFLRGEIAFHGYPWYLLAHPLIEAPILAQSADLVGVYGVGLLAALPAGLALDLWRAPGASARRTLVIRCGPPVLALLAGNLIYGAWRMQQPVGTEGPRVMPRVMVVQTNLPQDIKERWTIEQQQRDFNEWMNLTLDGVIEAFEREEPVDLVIWPETTVPGFGFEPETVRYLVENNYHPSDLFTSTIETFVERTGTPMLIGTSTAIGVRVVDQQWEIETRYNSAYLVAGGDAPHARYDKRFLTPFGETMPYISAWPWLEERLLGLAAGPVQFNLEEGDGPAHLPLEWRPGPLRIAAPICFEATMSRVCRELVRGEAGGPRADLMVNLTNDGWFGRHDPGRKQHAQVARFRAIELRTPMVRSANTGMSMVIDANGRIADRIGDGRYGEGRRADTLIAEVPLDSRRSLFMRIGNLVGWIAFITAAGLWLLPYFGGRSHRHFRKEST